MADEPQRILMTADTVGGVWMYAVELARGLAPHGVEVVLATMGRAASLEQRREVRPLGNVHLFENPARLEWMDEPWADVDRAGEWLLELEERWQPDLIHLNGYAHGSLPWQAPVLLAAHSCVLSWWQAVKAGAAPSRYREYQERVAEGLRGADLVVAPTAAMLDVLDEHYRFATPRRVISNGRSAADFVPSQKSEVIFSAGRIWDEAKNLALLERIAPQLGWEVRIAGDAQPPHGTTTRFSQVKALGFLTREGLAEELGVAAIYAAPARYEPFGLGILEAALSGCALVLGDIPSLRELWDGAAVFVHPEDERGWIATVNELSADSARRAALVSRSRERAQKFTPAAVVRGYREAYQTIRRSAAAPAPEAVAA